MAASDELRVRGAKDVPERGARSAPARRAASGVEDPTSKWQAKTQRDGEGRPVAWCSSAVAAPAISYP